MGPGITRPGSPLPLTVHCPLLNFQHNWKYFVISTDEEVDKKLIKKYSFSTIISWNQTLTLQRYLMFSFCLVLEIFIHKLLEPSILSLLLTQHFSRIWTIWTTQWVHFTTWSRLMSIPSKLLLTKLSWAKNPCGHCLQNRWGEYYFVSGRHGSLNGFSLFALNVRVFITCSSCSFNAKIIFICWCLLSLKIVQPWYIIIHLNWLRSEVFMRFHLHLVKNNGPSRVAGG